MSFQFVAGQADPAATAAATARFDGSNSCGRSRYPSSASAAARILLTAWPAASRALGRNTIIRRDGSSEPLGGIAHLTVSPGDILVIETPGGGGYGTEE